MILTYNQQVLLSEDRLERSLGGDLTGVVAGHVRVYVHQHHALTVTSVLLQREGSINLNYIITQ